MNPYKYTLQVLIITGVFRPQHGDILKNLPFLCLQGDAMQISYADSLNPVNFIFPLEPSLVWEENPHFFDVSGRADETKLELLRNHKCKGPWHC